MGLDLVEIVIAVEEKFGIKLTDEDVEKIITVGDLHRYILDRIELQEGTSDVVCLSSRVFYRFRLSLISSLGVDRCEVRPTASMEQLIPLADRRMTWQRLSESLGWKLPALRLPIMIEKGLIVLPLVTLPSIAFYWSLALRFSFSESVFLVLMFLFVAMLLIGIGMKLASSWAVCFPADGDSLRGVVERTLGLNYQKIAQEAGGWERPEDVWFALREMFVEVLAVRPDQVTEDAEIVRDLGAD